MKRLFSILCVVALLSSAAFAQEFAKKGAVEIGGNVGFSSITTIIDGQSDPNATTLFQISPTIGYFAIDGLELGINPLEFTNVMGQTSGLTTTGDSAFSQTWVGFWVFGAYHFSTGGTTFPYLQALVGYTSESSTGKSSVSGLSYGFAGGAKFKLTDGLLLNAGISYKFYTYNQSEATSRSGLNVLTVGVGIGGFFGSTDKSSGKQSW